MNEFVIRCAYALHPYYMCIANINASCFPLDSVVSNKYLFDLMSTDVNFYNVSVPLIDSPLLYPLIGGFNRIYSYLYICINFFV